MPTAVQLLWEQSQETSSQFHEDLAAHNHLFSVRASCHVLRGKPRTLKQENHLKVAACCAVQAALSAAGIEPSEDPVSTSDFEDALRASFGVTPYLYCEHGGGRDYINEVLDQVHALCSSQQHQTLASLRPAAASACASATAAEDCITPVGQGYSSGQRLLGACAQKAFTSSWLRSILFCLADAAAAAALGCAHARSAGWPGPVWASNIQRVWLNSFCTARHITLLMAHAVALISVGFLLLRLRRLLHGNRHVSVVWEERCIRWQAAAVVQVFMCFTEDLQAVDCSQVCRVQSCKPRDNQDCGTELIYKLSDVQKKPQRNCTGNFRHCRPKSGTCADWAASWQCRSNSGFRAECAAVMSSVTDEPDSAPAVPLVRYQTSTWPNESVWTTELQFLYILRAYDSVILQVFDMAVLWFLSVELPVCNLDLLVERPLLMVLVHSRDYLPVIQCIGRHCSEYCYAHHQWSDCLGIQMGSKNFMPIKCCAVKLMNGSYCTCARHWGWILPSLMPKAHTMAVPPNTNCNAQKWFHIVVCS